MGFDREMLARAIAAHGTVARVVIADHKGSTPRETGAAMLVWEAGTLGTIGGGRLEFDAIARARGMLGQGGRRLVRQPLGPALGQCCGGAVTLLIEVFGDIGDIPGGGVFARPVTDDGSGPPAGTVGPGLFAGWFVEPVAPPRPPVWIWGAGHVGRALVGALHGLPFDVTWVDDARDRFPEAIPDHATMLVAARLAEAVAHAPDNARHFVLTYSHALDQDICHAVLSRPFAALGLIGSGTKRARFLNRLGALGHRPDRLARLTCPIGDPTLGKEPQAIAVGVVHGLLKEQAAGESSRTDRGSVA